MDVLKHANVLRAIPLFASLDDKQLKLLAFTSEVYEYECGEFLCRQGEVSDSIFVILDGEVDVLVISEDELIVLASQRKGALMGEMAVLAGRATVRVHQSGQQG